MGFRLSGSIAVCVSTRRISIREQRQRVWLLPRDAAGNTRRPYQSGDGEGTASGFEFEVVWSATDKLQLNLGLGLIDTNYIQAGFFDGTTGQYPGAPFAYAADQSGTLGVQYEIPLSKGGRFLIVGNYGYMGDYARDSAYQRTLIDANGKPVLEPGYGILNSRFVYEPAARNFTVELWGKNLTDELYVNGGFDTRDTWGYDFSIVGRSREVGVSVGFTFVLTGGTAASRPGSSNLARRPSGRLFFLACANRLCGILPTTIVRLKDGQQSLQCFPDGRKVASAPNQTKRPISFGGVRKLNQAAAVSLLEEIEAFCRRTGIAESTFGRQSTASSASDCATARTSHSRPRQRFESSSTPVSPRRRPTAVVMQSTTQPKAR
jgi:hypothetical protein